MRHNLAVVSHGATQGSLVARRAEQAGRQAGHDPTPIVKFHTPEMVFGAGSLVEAGPAAARLGARRPMVVTDPGIVEAGWVAQLLTSLAGAGLTPVLFTEVTRTRVTTRSGTARRSTGATTAT